MTAIWICFRIKCVFFFKYSGRDDGGGVFYLPSALSASVENRMRKIGTKYWRVTTVR